MTVTQELLLYGCIALAIFFLMESFFYFLGNDRGQSDKRVKRRLDHGKLKGPDSNYQSLKKDSEENRRGLSIDQYYLKLLMNAGSPTSLQHLYFIVVVLCACIAFVFTTFIPIIPFFLATIISIIIGFGLPTLILKKQVKNRDNKFAEQFPDAIELMVRSLRVGQPLSAAMQTVGKELPDPIGTEFDFVSQEIAYGKDVSGALESMLDRISLQDLRFFVVAVQIQHESGGNLAEILDGLSKIIRGRFRLMRKVKALTAEGRFSAWFLSMFPVLMIFVMNFVNPGYYQKVSDYTYFPHLVAAIIVTLVINVIAMRIITTIRV